MQTRCFQKLCKKVNFPEKVCVCFFLSFNIQYVMSALLFWIWWRGLVMFELKTAFLPTATSPANPPFTSPDTPSP